MYLLQNNTKQKILGFQNTRLILSWANFLSMGKFLKPQILGWKLGWELQAPNQKLFVAEQVSWNRGTSINTLNDKQKKSAAVKNLSKKRSCQKYISNENLTHRCTQTRLFFKTRALFVYFQKRQGRSSPPSCYLHA